MSEQSVSGETPKFKLDLPFAPFCENDLEALSNQGRLQKRVEFEGIKGRLEIVIGENDLLSPFIQEDYIIPWEVESFDERRKRFPYQLSSLCFNETDGKTPVFELHFPNTPRGDFVALVADWDVVNGRYDATQYFFEAGKLENSVQIFLPRETTLLSQFQITAKSQLIQYPQSFYPKGFQ